MKKKITANQKWVPFFVAVVLVVTFFIGIRYYNTESAQRIEATDIKYDLTRMRPLTSRDHYRGNLNAPVQVIVFSDPECPYCKSLHMDVLPKLKMEYKNSIVIGYRHHLRPQFTRSPRESQALECASIVGGEELFWRYLDRIYQITPSDNHLDPQELYSVASHVGLPSDKFADCLDKGLGKARVDEDRQEANLNDIITAPTVVVLAKDRVPLYLPGAYLGPIRAAINSYLDEGVH